MKKIFITFTIVFFTYALSFSQQNLKHTFYGCKLGVTSMKEAIKNLSFFGYQEEDLLIDSSHILFKGKPNIYIEGTNGVYFDILSFTFNNNKLSDVTLQKQFAIGERKKAKDYYNTIRESICDNYGDFDFSVNPKLEEYITQWGTNSPTILKMSYYNYEGWGEFLKSGLKDYICIELHFQYSYVDKVVNDNYRPKLTIECPALDCKLGKTHLKDFLKNASKNGYNPIFIEDHYYVANVKVYDAKFDAAFTFEKDILKKVNFIKTFSTQKEDEAIKYYAIMQEYFYRKYGLPDEQLNYDKSDWALPTSYWCINRKNTLILDFMVSKKLNNIILGLTYERK